MLKEVRFEEKTIDELKDLEFIIPSYQRGYRWEKTQICNLLDDIKQYYDYGEKRYYYIQPIIIKKVENEENKYVLIDGQQRLTTIYMIAVYLLCNTNIENEIYSIEYETIKDKDNNENTLDLQEKIKEYVEDNDKNELETLNEYYYNLAIKSIKEWYANRGELENKKREFWDFIKKQVKVIWYELENGDNENEAFIRINTNNIKLTQADLVKAEFLRKKVIKSAREWDEIENRLFDQSFWYFISNQKTDDRMSELLSIVIQSNYDKEKFKNDSDENKIYNMLKKQIDETNNQNCRKPWKNIVEVMDILNEWYEDIELYNLIGYLILIGEKNVIVEYIQEYKNANKRIEVKEKILKTIKNKIFNVKDSSKEAESIKRIDDVKEYLKNLDYDDNKEKIKKILILHNILTLNSLKDKKIRFPFEKYKDSYYQDGKQVKWDIEHIHSQHDKALEDNEDKEEYINYLKISYINDSIAKRRESTYLNEKLEQIEELKNINNNNIKETAQEKGLEKILEENFEMNSIGNLALLDSKTNRSYQDSLFMQKREEIIKKDEIGFVPICTKKAFLKAYLTEDNDEDKLMQFFEWREKDFNSYLNDMAKKIFEKIFKKRIKGYKYGERGINKKYKGKIRRKSRRYIRNY